MTRNGGRTIDEREREVIDLIAERLGGAFSIPSSWRVLDKRGFPVDGEGTDNDVRKGLASRLIEDCVDESPFLPVVWRDTHRPMEQAMKGRSPAEKIVAMNPWRPCRFQVAPKARRDTDAIAAVSFAGLSKAQEAIWMLYATGDVSRYWATVKLYGLKGNMDPVHVHAIADAMQVILFRKAEMSQDSRARSLGLRASIYRALRAEYLSLLWGWIRMAANSYSRSLTGLSIQKVLAIQARNVTMLRNGVTTPAPLLTTVISSAEPANDEAGQGTQPPMQRRGNSTKAGQR